MKLAIMQPYFFPYVGYFALIDASDHFVIFDVPQYDRKGWMNRNRIQTHTPGEWQLIRVDTQKAPQQTPINEIQTRGAEWRERITAQLVHYKKRAPYYDDVRALVENIFSSDDDSLTHLNCQAIRNVCAYLDLPLHFTVFSEQDLEIKPVDHPGQWALNIAIAMDAQIYINPVGGAEIFNEGEFTSNNLKLMFLKHNLPYYPQRRGKEHFIPGLSILDVMMFNSPTETRALIQDYTLMSPDEVSSLPPAP